MALVGVVLLFVLQGGCVSNVSSQVKEASKDQSGVFDGTWVGEVQKSARAQKMQGPWTAQCQGDPWKLKMAVSDGVVQLRSTRFAKAKTYVSSSGTFRFDVPMSSKAKTTALSDLELGLTDKTFILYGNLKKAKGRVTIGIAEFGNSGCSAIVKFARTGASI